MTVLFTLIGVVVFFISLLTVGFKSAFRRLWKFTLTGLCIDILIVALSFAALYVLN